MEEFDTPIDPRRSFDALIGLEVLSVDEEEVRGVLLVRDDVKQPMGLVHGGIFASVAESLASLATWLAVRHDGSMAVGLSNNTSFLRPITEGAVHARGYCRHRGRTTWIWDVEMTDDEQRLCAVTRMTIAVRRGET